MSSSHDASYRWWYSLVNYEQHAPIPGDLKLEQMRALLDRLDRPQHNLRIVHVAGSKGKGSTAATLASIFQAAGLRVGLFTSPHLESVEERIQIDGQPISQPQLADVLTRVRAAASDHTTFFEVATAAGFVHFRDQRVDVAVVEVGLGGRFDCTNVCDPMLAIITSISYDHTRILGNRLEQIAMEKAGILKPGRPAISGVTVPEAREVIEAIAAERGCRLLQLYRDFQFDWTPGAVRSQPFAIRSPSVTVTIGQHTWPTMPLRLLGRHQGANSALAVAAVEELRQQGWKIADDAVARGLATVQWPARMEVVGHSPLIVLDCAHNVASALALVETLWATFLPSRRQLVFAGSNDKDLAGMLRALAPHFDHVHLTRYTNNPRATPPGESADLLRKTGDPLPWTVHESPEAALAAALAAAGTDDLVCITGSVFLAGELRPILLRR